jgi:4-amino-4-deoxy-L-arabinose transferase-like glycosyltransferase
MALLYFVFLYFGILASRSFQPDPLMVAMILVSVWAFLEWKDKRDWKWTVIAGLISGFAIFVKPMAAFILLGAYATALIAESGLRSSLSDAKVWTLALLAVLPFGIYYIDGRYISGFFEVKSALRFFPELWVDPKFYIRWYNMIGNTAGTGAFLLSLFALVLPNKNRSLVVGLWLGYIAYSLFFAYFIGTHNYYQLPLIPVVSISLSIVASALFETIAKNGSGLLQRFIVLFIILIGVTNVMWDARVTLVQDDFRSEEKIWAEIGDKLGHTTSGVIGLTHDYGNRLAYFGWQGSKQWLTSGDLNVRELGDVNVDLETRFANAAQENKYFVVTLFNQLDAQPKIKQLLEENYPVYAEGDGYKIYDLQHPLNP